MRLLRTGPAADAKELEITLCDLQAEVPPYAVLSHRWARPEDEVSFSEFGQPESRSKQGYRKIESCCRQALKDGLKYVWVDTCCINKESSAELSEAINSMYRWYKNSEICYVYLEDVKKEDYAASDSSLRCSKWFTRGWTLQELIAPIKVTFFATDWTEIGQKCQEDIAALIFDITGIPGYALVDTGDWGGLKDVCTSQIMYWASKRETTRIEDRAYSLLGLFNISLPILYGEGERSFQRLQEEIVRSRFDHTIFAWDLKKSYSGLLAESPDDFAQSGRIQKLPTDEYFNYFNLRNNQIHYTLTNLGIEIYFPYQESSSHMSLIAVLLACYFVDTEEHVVIYLRRLPRAKDQYYRARTSSGSICDPHGIYQNTSTWTSAENRCRVIAPEQFRESVMLPLIPDEVATQKNVSRKEDINCYRIILSCSDYIQSVMPIPHEMEKRKVTVETEAEIVWVALINFATVRKMKMYMVVIGNKLVYHLEAFNESDYSKITGLTKPLWAEECFRNWKSFVNNPCTKIVFDPIVEKEESKGSGRGNNDGSSDGNSGSSDINDDGDDDINEDYDDDGDDDSDKCSDNGKNDKKDDDDDEKRVATVQSYSIAVDEEPLRKTINLEVGLEAANKGKGKSRCRFFINEATREVSWKWISKDDDLEVSTIML